MFKKIRPVGIALSLVFALLMGTLATTALADMEQGALLANLGGTAAFFLSGAVGLHWWS